MSHSDMCIEEQQKADYEKKLSEAKQRQAMSVSPATLRRVADSLEKQGKEFDEGIGMEFDEGRQFLVPIANLTDESDTWFFEGYELPRFHTEDDGEEEK